MNGWRQARAIALLPGVVTVLVPLLVMVLGEGPRIGWGLDGIALALVLLLGSALVSAGLAIWVWTVRLFARVGRGTLAPWDPTSELVVEGPYRQMRNPMISAVAAVLLGEAAILGSLALLLWCAAFIAVNQIGFLVYEEPGLERRFGESYREYRRHVPRWVPRRPPWHR